MVDFENKDNLKRLITGTELRNFSFMNPLLKFWHSCYFA